MIKALSIKQPWDWLIVMGYKNIENRDWRFIPEFRGPLLIHASKGMTLQEYKDVNDFLIGTDIKLPDVGSLERGGIVGIANMVDVITESKSPWFFGPLGFVLEDARPIEFLPYKGQLGFFPVDEKLLKL